MYFKMRWSYFLSLETNKHEKSLKLNVKSSRTAVEKQSSTDLRSTMKHFLPETFIVSSLVALLLLSLRPVRVGGHVPALSPSN